MTKGKPSENAREARLAAALRANLRLRKAAQRRAGAPGPADGAEPPGRAAETADEPQS